MKEIVFAGYGGQGVLTAGLILSDIAVTNGENATWMPSYGSAMRGGTANCTVKYGKEYIYNPSQEEPDLLLAMNDPSLQKFLGIVAPGGVVLISELVTPCPSPREDVRIVQVPCMRLADEIGHTKGANIVMVGAIIRLMGDFTREQGLSGMNKMFEAKGKDKYSALNARAFEAGYAAI
ncbi:MAG: 2-oxoacid:acceptor oxidoreductase family protein [Fretibacterium sp.]|uniref:2-oxoacid:acceptor oxidoreductase family protein n=1 Tax=Fretibacterium sp. OH1220_COT-178 TaxID=2491047 RepID=UPI000F602D50|nr:2-oxoacid:acceptor oxidoreductase family protein [Fretibacterium sp. OH1220_COT-178]MDO4786802.1 2-oxoacid:acceptor oxidoreductase family protein [Fretibacterium sp.]RRD65261.1 keto:oxoacid ferredoxin oxidoreductase [Fretibacterium sp. OH1220_COT-178]